MKRFILATKVGRFIGLIVVAEIIMWGLYFAIFPFYKVDIRIMIMAVVSNIFTSLLLALTNPLLKTWL